MKTYLISFCILCGGTMLVEIWTIYQIIQKGECTPRIFEFIAYLLLVTIAMIAIPMALKNAEMSAQIRAEKDRIEWAKIFATH